MPIYVFLSHAPEDAGLLLELEKRLVMLERAGLMRGWSRRRKSAGVEVQHESTAKLDAAHLILLLVSADSLASDSVFEDDITRALARAKAGEARVIPILLRPCAWEDAPFAHLTALPSNRKPVTSWTDPEDAWADVVRGIRTAIEELGTPTPTASTSSPRLPTWELLRGLRTPEPTEPAFVELDRRELKLRVADFFAAPPARAQPRTLLLITGRGGRGKSCIGRWLQRTLESQPARAVAHSSYSDADNSKTIIDLARVLQHDLCGAGIVERVARDDDPDLPFRLLEALDGVAREAGGVFVWVLDHVECVLSPTKDLVGLAIKLVERKISHVRLVLVVRSNHVKAEHRAARCVSEVEVPAFSENEVIELAGRTHPGASMGELQRLLHENPMLLEPFAWKLLKGVDILEVGNSAHTLPTLFDHYKKGLTEDRVASIEKKIGARIDEISSSDEAEADVFAAAASRDEKSTATTDLEDWLQEIWCGDILARRGPAAILALARLELHSHRARFRTFVEQATRAALEFLATNDNLTDLRKCLVADDGADLGASRLQIAPSAAWACVVAVRHRPQNARTIIGWFTELPPFARLAVAEVAITLDMASRHPGIPSLLALAVRHNPIKSIREPDPVDTLQSAFAGMRRHRLFDSEFLDAVRRAMTDVANFILAKNGGMTRWFKVVYRAIVHMPQLAAASMYILALTSMWSEAAPDKVIFVLQPAWDAIRRSGFRKAVTLVLPLFSWFAARRLLHSMGKLPKHNPHHSSELPAFFRRSSAERQEEFGPILRLARTHHDPAMQFDLFVAETQRIYVDSRCGEASLGATFVEFMWGLFIQDRRIQLVRIVSALEAIFLAALKVNRRVGAQSCVFIVYHAILTRQQDAKSSSVLDVYESMVRIWVQSTQGDYSTASTGLYVLHICRFARLATMSGCVDIVTRIDSMINPKMLENRLYPLFEEAICMGYEFNLWELAASLLEKLCERALLKEVEHADEFKYQLPALLRQLRNQRPDQFSRFLNLTVKHRGHRKRLLGDLCDLRTRLPANPQYDVLVDERALPQRDVSCAFEDAVFYVLGSDVTVRPMVLSVCEYALSTSSAHDWIRQVLMGVATQILSGASAKGPAGGPSAP